MRPARPRTGRRFWALAPRLSEGVAAWRDPDAVIRAVRGWVETSLARPADRDHEVLVAEVSDEVTGFCSLYVEEQWSGEPDVYISELAVATSHEGKGSDAR